MMRGELIKEREFANNEAVIEKLKSEFKTLQTVEQVDSNIERFLPFHDLDVEIYGPYKDINGEFEDRYMFISWKEEHDDAVKKRSLEYFFQVLKNQYHIFKWPKAEEAAAVVEFDQLKIKKTHHRLLIIWYY